MIPYSTKFFISGLELWVWGIISSSTSTICGGSICSGWVIHCPIFSRVPELVWFSTKSFGSLESTNPFSCFSESSYFLYQAIKIHLFYSQFNRTHSPHPCLNKTFLLLILLVQMPSLACRDFAQTFHFLLIPLTLAHLCLFNLASTTIFPGQGCPYSVMIFYQEVTNRSTICTFL